MMRVNRDENAVLVSLPTEAEAAMLVQLLESRGIMAKTVGGLTSGFRAEAPGQVKILVHNEDLSKAREILSERRKA
jgi:hypothetical protein